MKKNYSIKQTGRKFWSLQIDGQQVACGTLEQIKLQIEIMILVSSSSLEPQ